MADNEWRVPRDWSALEDIPFDTLNAHIRDQFIHIKAPPYAASALIATVSFSNGSYTGITSALTFNLTTYGGMIEFGFVGNLAANGGNGFLDVAIDNTGQAPSTNGYVIRTSTANACFNAMATGIASGAHSIVLNGMVDGGGDAKLISGAVFWAGEVP